MWWDRKSEYTPPEVRAEEIYRLVQGIRSSDAGTKELFRKIVKKDLDPDSLVSKLKHQLIDLGLDRGLLRVEADLLGTFAALKAAYNRQCETSDDKNSHASNRIIRREYEGAIIAVEASFKNRINDPVRATFPFTDSEVTRWYTSIHDAGIALGHALYQPDEHHFLPQIDRQMARVSDTRTEIGLQPLADWISLQVHV